MDEQPQGRSAKEAMVIVAADRERFNVLHDLWQEMTEAQQVELVATAQKMVAA